MKRAIVIFDLDGTLCAGNTFHLFLLYVVLHPLSGASLHARLLVLGLVIQRLLHRISHAEMKRETLLAVSSIIDVQRFVEHCVVPRLNQECVGRLTQHATEGFGLVLATAAPQLYAATIGAKLGIDIVIATPDPAWQADWREVLREEKLRSVMSRLSDVEIHAVYTDHHDDLALLQRAKRKILVRPSAATLARLAAVGIQIDEVLG